MRRCTCQAVARTLLVLMSATAAAAVPAPTADGGPFGISLDSSLPSDYKAAYRCFELPSSEFEVLMCRRAPRPLSDASLYTVTATKASQVVARLEAYIDFEADGRGTKATARFSELADLLRKKYGKPSEEIDRCTMEDMDHPKWYWMNLLRGSRIKRTTWKDIGSHSSVSLYLVAVPDDTTTVRLIVRYEHREALATAAREASQLDVIRKAKESEVKRLNQQQDESAL